MKHSVYVLKSLLNNRHYIGCSSDLQRRISEHNDGKVKSTKAYKPWKIIYYEAFDSKEEAFYREREIKSFKGGIKFRKLLEGWQSG
jgi:putative endonuclease